MNGFMKTWLIKYLRQISYRPLFIATRDQRVTPSKQKEEEGKEKAEKDLGRQESGGRKEQFSEF